MPFDTLLLCLALSSLWASSWSWCTPTVVVDALVVSSLPSFQGATYFTYNKCTDKSTVLLAHKGTPLIPTTTRTAALPAIIESMHRRDLSKPLLSLEQVASFRNGQQPFLYIPQALPVSVVSHLVHDATSLQRSNFGAIAGVGTRRSANQKHKHKEKQSHRNAIRHNVHQTWLLSPGSPSPMDFLVGNLDARKQLLRFVENIRLLLNNEPPTNGEDTEAVAAAAAANSWGRGSSFGESNSSTDTSSSLFPFLPSGMEELSYLHYPPGAFYNKHVDTFISPTSSPIITRTDERFAKRRAVSFVIYLGGDSSNGDGMDGCVSGNNNMRPWDLDRDGGALRVYGKEYAVLTGLPVVTVEQEQCSSESRSDESNTQKDSNSISNNEEDDDDDDDDDVFSDIPPLPGSLVLFHSAKIPHAVTKANRSRRCIVGWFNELL